MATSKDFLDYLKEQLSGLNDVTFRPMMGEYLIYYRGRLVGDICDDRLLIKPVPTALKMMPDAEMQPPYKGAKEMLVADVDNGEFLKELFNAIYEELPPPKPKKKKT
ncbi:MAG: TfoX/Sxy family protein [Clostridia bacterium]|nr:TfoX/Sxy family protein [Clostridia bacterium]